MTWTNFSFLLYGAYAGHMTDYYTAWTDDVASLKATTCSLTIRPGGSHMTPPVTL